MNFQSLPMNGENGLRALATGTYGITNVKQYKKAELVALLEAAQGEGGNTRTGVDTETVDVTPVTGSTEEIVALLQDTAAKADAEKAPSRKLRKRTTKKVCTDCGKRPQDASVIGPELCEECYEYAGWENQHGDDAHEEVAAYDSAEKASGTKAPFDKKILKQIRRDMANCPVCHPELDPRAIADAKPQRAGTSRLGMKLSVKVRDAGQEKALQTLARIDAAGFSGRVKNVAKEGVVRLVTEQPTGRYTLVWSTSGAFLYDESGVVRDGKAVKVRNNKAALSQMGIEI